MIEPMPAAAILRVDLWGDLEACVDRFARALGPPPPGVGRSADASGDVRGLWIEPRGWLVRGTASGRERLSAELEAVVGEDGAVTDVSAGFSRLRISGPGWRVQLSVGGVIETGGADVGPGWTAGTVIEHIAVRLDVVDEEAVDIYVAPSYAPHLRRLWAADARN